VRILPKEIDIDPKDPFKNDILGKKEYAVQLMNLMNQVEEPLVLAINAPWGEGKTTFVKMWQMLLEQNDFKTIFFDAFAHDYIHDPFLAVVGEIYSLFELILTEKKDKRKLEDFKNRASQAGLSLLSVGLNVGTKFTTGGLADISDLKDVLEALLNREESVKALVDKISSYKAEREAVEDFKKILAEMAEEAKEKTGKPLIFIIDELDRCKPTYALDMIEKIKHFFLVEGIVYVLVLNKEQLEEAIRGIYGQGINASPYLQKFISVECRLPKREERGSECSRFCQKLVEEYKISHDYPFDSLAKAFQLSLRDMQRWFSLLQLFKASSTGRCYKHFYLTAFLSAVKIKEPDIFKRLRSKKITYKELEKYFSSISSRRNEESKQFLDAISSDFKLCLEGYPPDSEEDPLHVGQFHMHPDEVIPLLCERLEFFSIPAPTNKPE